MVALTQVEEILNSIYLKTNLQEYYKKSISREFYKLLQEYEIGFVDNVTAHTIDVQEDYEHILYATSIKKNDDEKYHVIYADMINKVIPFATQSSIAIHKNLDGTLINDVNNLDPNYRVASLCIVVFPLKETTLVLAFCESEDVNRYSGFIKYFNQLKRKDKLKLIQAIILLYTEEAYYTNEIKEIVTKDKWLQNKREQLTFHFSFEDEFGYIELNGFRKINLFLNEKAFFYKKLYFNR